MTKLTMSLFAVYQVQAFLRVTTWIAGGAPDGAPAQPVAISSADDDEDHGAGPEGLG